jgi:hypothetical protein
MIHASAAACLSGTNLYMGLAKLTDHVAWPVSYILPIIALKV